MTLPGIGLLCSATPIDPSSWPIVVQALIVVGCATLLVARERRRSYR